MLRLLVSCFEPFGGAALNSSQQVVRHLSYRYDGFEIIGVTLPTSYQKAASEYFKLKDKFKPDAALCLGEAVGRPSINIEQQAHNYADSSRTDNDGVCLQKQQLEADGSQIRQTILATDPLVDAVLAVGVPAVLSFSAGRFVCNALYYAVLSENFPVCFVHIPGLPEAVADKLEVPTMPLEQAVTGVEAICAAIVRQVEV